MPEKVFDAPRTWQEYLQSEGLEYRPSNTFTHVTQEGSKMANLDQKIGDFNLNEIQQNENHSSFNGQKNEKIGDLNMNRNEFQEEEKLSQEVDGDVDHRKVFVGGLSHKTTDESLTRYFIKFGTIVSAQVLRDALSMSSRKFGFVKFNDPKVAANVIETGMSFPHIVDGKEVEVKQAQPKNAVSKATGAPLTPSRHSVYSQRSGNQNQIAGSLSEERLDQMQCCQSGISGRRLAVSMTNDFVGHGHSRTQSFLDSLEQDEQYDFGYGGDRQRGYASYDQLLPYENGRLGYSNEVYSNQAHLSRTRSLNPADLTSELQNWAPFDGERNDTPRLGDLRVNSTLDYVAENSLLTPDSEEMFYDRRNQLMANYDVQTPDSARNYSNRQDLLHERCTRQSFDGMNIAKTPIRTSGGRNSFQVGMFQEHSQMGMGPRRTTLPSLYSAHPYYSGSKGVSGASGEPDIEDEVLIPNKIFVGGLLYATGHESLRRCFEKYGAVEHAEVIYNRETKKSRGFGFVIFKDNRVVEQVLHFQNTDRIEVDGKVVEIKACKAREDTVSAMLERDETPKCGYLRTPIALHDDPLSYRFLPATDVGRRISAGPHHQQTPLRTSSQVIWRSSTLPGRESHHMLNNQSFDKFQDDCFGSRSRLNYRDDFGGLGPLTSPLAVESENYGSIGNWSQFARLGTDVADQEEESLGAFDFLRRD